MNDCRYKYVFYEKREDSPCHVCGESDCENSFCFFDWEDEFDADIDAQEDY
jgi:hypothetical protein